MHRKISLYHGKTSLMIIILNLSQIALVAAVLFYLVSLDEGASILSNPWMIIFLLCILLSIIINSMAAFRSRAGILRTGYQLRILQDTLSKLEKLNSTLKAQRHDFMNHLQVVYSLIEMDEYKSAGEYIEKVYKDIEKVNKVLKTSNAAVNALLQAKSMAFEKLGITVNLEVTTQLEGLKVPAWELCRVIGNLMDNAAYALQAKSDNRILKIELHEDLKYYYFRVSDNGDPIPAHLISKVFDPGFTTKGDKGEGMGLHISREIIRNYGGSIGISSDLDNTTVDVRIPRM